ncbi:MAG: AMP-binding protein, partial [Deltaproteobacteria bacterium]|nr:AMP-binding protein [Deltaproteobacteria bacterium]
MSLNLGSILMGSASERADHPAVVLGDQKLSYAELDRAARGFATSLRDRGVLPGQQVAIMVPNLPDFTIAYFGILYACCTIV